MNEKQNLQMFGFKREAIGIYTMFILSHLFVYFMLIHKGGETKCK